MSKHTIVRRSLAAAVGGVAALTLIGGTAQAAESHAGTVTSPKAAATAASTSYALPVYGSSGLMPTWVLGGTNLCAFNYGFTDGVLKVQSLTGAAPEYISVAPFQQQCINRWWFGVPVRTTNVSNAPLYVSGS